MGEDMGEDDMYMYPMNILTSSRPRTSLNLASPFDSEGC